MTKLPGYHPIDTVTAARDAARVASLEHRIADLERRFVETPMTVAGQGVVLNNDARLTNARTPTAHQSTHGSGGSDRLIDGGKEHAWGGGDISWTRTFLAGTYLFAFHGSGFKTAVGLGYWQCFIGGTFIGDVRYYFNQTNVHQEMNPLFITRTMAAGNAVVRMNPLDITTDTNDSRGFWYVRIG